MRTQVLECCLSDVYVPIQRKCTNRNHLANTKLSSLLQLVAIK